MSEQDQYEWTIEVTGQQLIDKGTVLIDGIPVDPEKKYLVIPLSLKIEEKK